jgi:Ca2+-binding EF-hand superfamily protein
MNRFLFRVLVYGTILTCLGGPSFAQVPEKPDWKVGFRAHDKNGDAMIDRAEFHEWMVDAFFHKDINHKGYLVFEDIKDVMVSGTFKTYDKNGDGNLSLTEFLNAVFLDFEAADVDRNGALTIEEIDIYIKRTRK